ncbi:MAG: hypothetical protein HY717_16280 [Planctomycetes bacterium]|nr:hypothetical protein [Planctomycetota bacterium]
MVLLWLALRLFSARSPLKGAFVLAIGTIAIACLAVFYVQLFIFRHYFQVPTGAMAPAILGNHANYQCATCAFSLAVGIPVDATGFSQERLRALVVPCPYCGGDRLLSLEPEVQGGDHIEVELGAEPRRWDLVAFHAPESPDKIYVKRLVGLPGEKLQIVGGDLFIDGRRLVKAPEELPDLWLLANDTRFYASAPKLAISAWMPAPDGSRWRREGASWFFNGESSGEERLEFGVSLSDQDCYNVYSQRAGRGNPDVQVRDVLIECSLGSFSGPGGLGFHWKHGDREVRATLEASGQVELSFEGTKASGRLSRPLSELKTVLFAFRDGVAAVLESAERPAVLQLAVDPEELASASPPREDLPCQVAITARQCKLAIERIVVKRDVHYRSDFRMAEIGTRQPMVLGADECFVLGDNSPNSFDSRFWRKALTRPAILGMARGIAWPPARRRAFGPGAIPAPASWSPPRRGSPSLRLWSSLVHRSGL